MKRWLGATGATLGVLTIAGVLVHLPPVQRAMGWRNAAGEVICPIGFTPERTTLRATLEEAARDGARPANPQPALGFTLDRTTRADLVTWAARHGVRCSEQHGGATLQCLDVPAVALGGDGLAANAAWFELDAAGTVQRIKTSRRAAEVAPVAAWFRATEQALASRAGVPTLATGDASDAGLARGAFQQAMVEHRTRGYRAVVRATNLGDGYLLTESYAAVPL